MGQLCHVSVYNKVSCIIFIYYIRYIYSIYHNVFIAKTLGSGWLNGIPFFQWDPPIESVVPEVLAHLNGVMFCYNISEEVCVLISQSMSIFIRQSIHQPTSVP